MQSFRVLDVRAQRHARRCAAPLSERGEGDRKRRARKIRRSRICGNGAGRRRRTGGTDAASSGAKGVSRRTTPYSDPRRRDGHGESGGILC